MEQLQAKGENEMSSLYVTIETRSRLEKYLKRDVKSCDYRGVGNRNVDKRMQFDTYDAIINRALDALDKKE